MEEATNLSPAGRQSIQGVLEAIQMNTLQSGVGEGVVDAMVKLEDSVEKTMDSSDTKWEREIANGKAMLVSLNKLLNQEALQQDALNQQIGKLVVMEQDTEKSLHEQEKLLVKLPVGGHLVFSCVLCVFKAALASSKEDVHHDCDVREARHTLRMEVPF